MTESSWSLVVPVLLVGLALGTAWVLWWRRRRAGEAAQSSPDRQLLLADLQARQAQLYEQLREASGVERESLELAAARNLRAIEQAGGAAPAAAPAQSQADAVVRPTTRARAASPWLGFVGGVACAALVGLLIVWAQRDAKPRPPDESGPMATPQEAVHPDPALGERERQALDELASMIDNDPTDVMARKQYAVALLSTSQFVPAFEQAEILLASNPEDPDGLYVKGMVRMRMGNTAEAQGLLEKLIVDYPDHVPALTALGVLALRDGGLPAAEEYWHEALEISGGRNPEVERLMAAAREQFGGEGSVPEAARGAAMPQDLPAAPASAAAAPDVAGPAYTVELELAPGASAAPGAALFVSLRSATGGPPTAVKRINGPRFPLFVTLSAADSMMGQPLPDAGLVVVRLDIDGNASTRTEGEPTGEVEMRLGETVRLTLK